MVKSIGYQPKPPRKPTKAAPPKPKAKKLMVQDIVPDVDVGLPENIAESKNTKNVIFFDVYMDSSHSKLNDVVSFLSNSLKPPDRFDKADFWKCMKKVVVNLFLAAHHDDAWVATTRDKNSYSSHNKMRKIFMSYEKTIFILDTLHKEGWTEIVHPYNDKLNPKNNRMYLMKASSNLKKKFYGIPPTSLYELNMHDPIELRDVNDKSIVYKDTDGTKRMRQEMNVINALLDKSEIRLSFTDDELNEVNVSRHLAGKDRISTFKKFLTRIFNSRTSVRKKWVLGGRLYRGFWQNIPKNFRPLITIDGEATVELDYKAFHPNLIYLEKTGKFYEPYGGDPYVMDGYEGNDEMRRLMKTVLLVLINAETEKKTMGGIKEECEKAFSKDPEGFGEAFTLYKELKPRKLVDMVKGQHPQIAEYFGSDRGIHLQFKDSNLSVKILLRLAAEGILALPVHDSFIVQARHKDKLEQAMREEFQKMFGAEPGIDEKKGSKDKAMFLGKVSKGASGAVLQGDYPF